MIALIIAAVVVVLLLFLLIFGAKSAKPHENALWHDRKRTFLGLPWSFTVYELTEDRIFIQRGVFTVTDEEIRLYRVLDIAYKASLGQRIFGLGTITLMTSDKTAGKVDIQSVKDARKVKEMIAKHVEEQRDKKRVFNREMMVGETDMLMDEEV